MLNKALKNIYIKYPIPFKHHLKASYSFAKASLQGSVNVHKIKFHKSHDSVCVLGNGPSLNNDKDNIKLLIDTHDFICVNNFSDDHLYCLVKPKLYIFADTSYYTNPVHKDWEDKRNIAFREINSKTTWPIKIIVPHDADIDFLKRNINNSNVEIIKTSSQGIFFNKYSNALKFLYDSGIYEPPRLNVLLNAIFIAITTGYKNIKIFGADLSFHKDVSVDQNNNDLYIKYRHFNESDKVDILLKNPQKVDKWTMGELLESSAKTFICHEVLYNYGSDKNISITNLSSHSLIDAYPRS